jgi:hypothetical protein
MIIDWDKILPCNQGEGPQAVHEGPRVCEVRQGVLRRPRHRGAQWQDVRRGAGAVHEGALDFVIVGLFVVVYCMCCFCIVLFAFVLYSVFIL